MMTVLIRYLKTKVEVLYEAVRVEYSAEKNSKIDSPGLIIERPDGVCSHFSNGDDGNEENFRDVFVMNREGQTVARYSLT